MEENNPVKMTPDEMRQELLRNIRENNQEYMNEIAVPGVSMPVLNQKAN